jgi:hypothetical protein
MFNERAEVEGISIYMGKEDLEDDQTNPTKYDVRSNPSHRSAKTAINCLSFKTALAFLD